MAQDLNDKLGANGPVEVDETYVGGKPRYRSGKIGRAAMKIASKKTMVLGAIERGGCVFACTAESATAKTLTGFVVERVLPSSTVYTDEYKGYNDLSDPVGGKMKHSRINHSQKVYVSGDVHTNTIEGFWSLVKRGIGGVYHSVSAKHLNSYLSEYAWRYNQRFEPRSRFLLLLLRSTLGR